jgi:hypothetical protein
MEQTIIEVLGTGTVYAALEGGPGGIPPDQRTQVICSDDEKIKLPYYGGYEHFERTLEIDETIPPPRIIFRWTMRTKVAELAAAYARFSFHGIAMFNRSTVAVGQFVGLRKEFVP